MPFRKLTATKLPIVDDPRPVVRVPAGVLLALAMGGAALWAVALLEPLLARPYVFPVFAAIVVMAVMVGGRYGVITTVAFALGYAYWYLEPRHVLAVRNPHEVAALAAYGVVGSVVAAIGGALRRAYHELREQHTLLDHVHRQREDLLRALTHDIRTPLAVIRMSASTLTRKDPADLRRVTSIQNSVNSIDAMLRDLVEVVALESDQVKLNLVAVDVGVMLHRLQETLAGSVPIERVNVVVPPDLRTVAADPQRLERVFVNLISNALKYSPGKVAVRVAQDGENVVVSVSDEGPGIPAADLPRIFEKYYRAANAGTRDGLGLGLYISRLLVLAHGGRIWAESVPGKGSTFNVAVPAPPAPVRAAAPAAQG